VFTGAVPFSGTTSMMVMLSITQGNRPLRPTLPSFTAGFWALTQRCWAQEPLSRPIISDVAIEILTLSIRDRLVGRAPATHELISPVVTDILGNGQAKAAMDLSQDDAQILIDVVDEVIPFAIPCSQDGLADFVPNLRILSNRY